VVFSGGFKGDFNPPPPSPDINWYFDNTFIKTSNKLENLI
jgi:hypothetical protein